MSKFLTAPQWYDAGGGLNKSLDVNCNGYDTATAFGNGANAVSNGVAVGESANANDSSVAIGAGSTASLGVAVGIRANAGLDSVAIGNGANASKYHDRGCIAIGLGARCVVDSKPFRRIQFFDRTIYPSIRADLIGFGADSLLDLIYPVDSIYISVSPTDPGTIFGGTWEAFATGKTLVGVDAADTDFNAAGNEGGSKASSLPRHSHSFERAVRENPPVTAYLHEVGVTFSGDTSSTIEDSSIPLPDGTPGKYQISSEGIEDVSSGNMPPYITVYMWKRTA